MARLFRVTITGLPTYHGGPPITPSRFSTTAFQPAAPSLPVR